MRLRRLARVTMAGASSGFGADHRPCHRNGDTLANLQACNTLQTTPITHRQRDGKRADLSKGGLPLPLRTVLSTAAANKQRQRIMSFEAACTSFSSRRLPPRRVRTWSASGLSFAGRGTRLAS